MTDNTQETNVEEPTTNEEEPQKEEVEEGGEAEKTEKVEDQPKKVETEPQDKEIYKTKEELLKDPNIQKIIEKVRSEEKAKLYNSLENKDDKIKELKGEVDKLSEEISATEESNKTEVEKLKEELTDLKQDYTNLKEEYETDKEQSEREKKQAKLEAYKEKKIREVREQGEDLVTSLVGGDSEEDIDTSIEMAKKEYQEIRQKTLKETGEKEGKKSNVSNTPKVTNPQGSGDDLDISANDIKNMSMAEYRKNRDKIKRALQQGELQ